VKARNPDYAARVRELCALAPFVQELGIALDELGEGRCVTSLLLEPRHRQQNGYAHAGVVATLADHSAGVAAGSLVGPDEAVLTVEFKVNLLRPGRGERLRCRAGVLKAGRTLTVAESEIFAVEGEAETLIAKATVTLAMVPYP
jgi:uncharacterized protein (TIGR00369 family)